MVVQQHEQHKNKRDALNLKPKQQTYPLTNNSKAQTVWRYTLSTALTSAKSAPVFLSDKEPRSKR